VSVGFFIECKNEENRKIYFEKMISLKQILTENYLPEVLFDAHYHLENGKVISKVWVELTGIRFFSQKDWPIIFQFFHDSMEQFEYFYDEYQDYIQDLNLNQ
jgi:hypothetical protein